MARSPRRKTSRKRRALGQHFLADRDAITTIVETLFEEISRGHCRGLLEIGPGKGALTHPIATKLPSTPAVTDFLVVEKDRTLAEEWRKAGTRVVEADFLDLDKTQWMPATPLAVVSNLPYSAATGILTRLTEEPFRIPVMVLMFQKEVGTKIRSEPGTRETGSLSIWIQNLWYVRKLIEVPRDSFRPRPAVDSEVLVFNRREAPKIGATQEFDSLWQQLLKTAFAHRRQMLRRVYKSHPSFERALEAAGVDGKKRAEELGWEDWQRLFGAALRP